LTQITRRIPLIVGFPSFESQAIIVVEPLPPPGEMPDTINPSAPIIGSTRLWVVITTTTVIVVARVLLFAFVSRKPARSLLHLWAWIERALPGRPRLESIPLLLYLIDGSGRGIGWMFLSWYGCGFSYCLYHLHAWGPPQRSSWERIAVYPTYALLAWLIVKRLSAVFGWTLLVAVALLLGIVTYMDFYPAAYTRRCPPKIAATVRGSCALIKQILLFPPGVFFLYTFSARPPSIKFDFGPADAADSDFRRRYTSTGPSSHAFPPDDTTSAGYIGTFDPLPVPPGCSEVVARVLTARSHYAVLGVEERANEDQIRRAKRMLSLQTHPDKAGSQPGAADACQRVLEAADVLLDDRLRREYDKDLALLRLAASDKGAAVRETVADRLYEETGIDIDQIGSCEFLLFSSVFGHFRCISCCLRVCVVAVLILIV
jgi:hypothetical protein